MDANEYTKWVMSKSGLQPGEATRHQILNWGAMNIAGEAGEFANYAKKVLFHQHDLDAHKVLDELGDILWYVAATAKLLGSDLDGVMLLNMDKLNARYPDKFDPERSKNRKETQDASQT